MCVCLSSDPYSFPETELKKTTKKMAFTPPTIMTTFTRQWVFSPMSTADSSDVPAPATSSRKRLAEEVKMELTDDGDDCIFLEERPLESKRTRPNWDSNELVCDNHPVVPKLSFQAITTTNSAARTTVSSSMSSSTISPFILNYQQSRGQLYSADVTDNSERPYDASWLLCTVKGCWKKVKDEEALVRHLVQEHSVWPYKCALRLCPQSFATMCVVQAHFTL